MTDIRRDNSDGLWIGISIVAVIIIVIVAGGGALLYRQAAQARAQAAAERAAAEQREREIRSVTRSNMKELADLEEKENAAAAADPAVKRAQLHTDLAESYLKTGDRERAIEQFKNAVEELKRAFGENDPRVREAEERLKKAQNP